MNDSLTGHLLVASSLVTDPIYAGGVCLVVHEDGGQVIGVMLNRPMKPSPEALLALLKNHQSADQDPPSKSESGNRLAPPSSPVQPSPQSLSIIESLHFGGPISGPVVAIHQDFKMAEAETGDGIYVAAQKHHLEQLVQERQTPFRLIVGHLDWTREQLNAEILAGIWHCVPATRQAVFAAPQDMWASVIRRATTNSMSRWLGLPDLINANELN
ncbi:YqgE/AlgH family protein [Rubripirellula amarantea]|nr:YqgE/AlgH family protein [Rubripirellula amarantea]